MREATFKIYVEPFAPRVASFSDRYRKHLGSYAVLLSLPRYNRVQNECVNPAVPDDIHKSDERPLKSCAHPSKTMSVRVRPPVVIGLLTPKRFRM